MNVSSPAPTRPSAATEPQQLRRACHLGRALGVLAGVLDDRVGKEFLSLLEVLSGDDGLSADVALDARAAYGRLFAWLTEEAELSERSLVGDAWQNHLLERLLADENALSRKLERAEGGQVGASLLAQVRQDLARLQALYQVDGRALAGALGLRFGAADDSEAWLPWDELRPLHDRPERGDRVSDLKQSIANAEDWRDALPRLMEHYTAGGAGLFGRYRAFRWAGSVPGTAGRLEGIANPDPIRLDELIGYETERELLIRNTEWFLEGLPANNVLIYGERGTGKSSTIKALLNVYAERGLRMIELSKHDLRDLPAILSLLRGRRERFVLFVDDLSFEQHETHYKELKAMLEGSLEARPSNVLLYASSNRRHLVQERWADRAEFDHEDVHSRDAMQEKLSLADRFGISLTFIAPDQDRFLAIVSGLARQRELDIAREDLRRRAIRWVQWQNARSGRTARQFVDYLTAELRSEGRGQ